ncbi:MAG: thioredoxin domain-containing protein [Candidatus Parcubacteria bacterium]|nr:thioredoxin domain-containing protein [Candidatus Parcubacteria bacterium]
MLNSKGEHMEDNIPVPAVLAEGTSVVGETPAVDPTNTSPAASPPESPENNPESEAQIVVLNDDNFDAEISDPNMLVLVDFWAQYCYGCRLMDPLVKRMAVQFAGRLKVCMINVNLKSDAAFIKCDLTSVPTVILFKNGQEVWRARGRDLDDLPTTMPLAIQSFL